MSKTRTSSIHPVQLLSCEVLFMGGGIVTVVLAAVKRFQ